MESYAAACMYVCIYVCMYVCMYLCVCIYVCIYDYMYVVHISRVIIYSRKHSPIVTYFYHGVCTATHTPIVTYFYHGVCTATHSPIVTYFYHIVRSCHSASCKTNWNRSDGVPVVNWYKSAVEDR